MRIEFEVSGDVQLSRDLDRWASAVEDPGPAFEAMADDFLEIEARQFASEGGNSGGWAPLAPSTVRRRGSAHPILFQTGRLQQSLTSAGARDSVRRVTADSLEVGTSVPYARFHQQGTARMPRRRPVEFTEVDRRRWVKLLQEHLVYSDPMRRAV